MSCLNPLLLLLDQQLRITDDVDEEDMSDLEPKIVLRFRGHAVILTGVASHLRSFSAVENFNRVRISPVGPEN